MGGGLMQLVAYGAQDIYLTGNPQITFFKVVYRRHTNFSCESIEQTPNGTVDFGNKVSFTISRNGDLVHRCYLEMSSSAAVGSVTNSLLWVKTATVEIGGQQIDKHYGEWLHMWTNLTHTTDKLSALSSMALYTGVGVKTYVPLQFWFCRNPGLALPLIALQYHEVKIQIEFQSKGFVDDGGSPDASLSAALWCDYIYLDTDERRRFAQVSHEYLIEQLQFNGTETLTDDSSPSIDLNLNHPVKALYWTQSQGEVDDSPYTQVVAHHLGDQKLVLNGHDRFAARNHKYFTDVQRYQHHSGYPATGATNTFTQVNTRYKINMYSFALEPEEHQPSGTCNFSRIDNAQLKLGQGSLSATPALNGKVDAPASTGTSLNIYAVNYNVLRIMSGMGGLAYSN